METNEIEVLKFLIIQFKEEIDKKLSDLRLEYESIEKPIEDDLYRECMEIFDHILPAYIVDFDHIINNILKNIEKNNFNINLIGIDPTTFYRKGRAIIHLIRIYEQENKVKHSLNKLISKFEDINHFYYSTAKIIQDYVRV